MNHLLSETYNLDRVIQEVQVELYEKLTAKWSTTKLDGYGRVYKNEGKNGIIPEVYDATTKNYKQTLYNGQSCFFFVDDDNHPIIDQDHEFTTNVKVVFMLNLSDLKTSTERVDADVKRDVTAVLRDFDYHFRIEEYIQGLDNVLNGFDTSKIKDMQPYFTFAINTSWSYSVI